MKLANFVTLHRLLSFFFNKKIMCVELATRRKSRKMKEDKVKDTQIDKYDDYDNTDFSEHQQRCHFIYQIEYC